MQPSQLTEAQRMQIEKEQRFMFNQQKLIKYVENEEIDKFESLLKQLEKFEVFRLRFTMNHQGLNLIHLCVNHENLSMLKILLKQFRDCYSSLLN